MAYSFGLEGLATPRQEHMVENGKQNVVFVHLGWNTRALKGLGFRD